MDKEVADEIMYSSIPDLVRAITKLHVKLDVLSETVKEMGDRLKLLEKGREVDDMLTIGNLTEHDPVVWGDRKLTGIIQEKGNGKTSTHT